MDVLSDVLAATRIGGVVTGCVDAAAPWGMRLTDAPSAAFHAVTQGMCWLRMAGHEPRQLVTGDITLLPHGDGHGLSSERRGRLVPFDELLRTRGSDTLGRFDLPGSGPRTKLICGAYRYDAFVAHPLLTMLPQVVHIPADRSAGQRDLAEALRMLASELEGGRPGSRTVVDRLVDIVFVHVLRLWTETNRDAGASWLLALHDPEIAAAITHIHQEPARPWTVEMLAREVGVSRATLARRFTSLVGEPPLTYLTRWRTELAARRLRDTSESLSTIARSVGYTSEFAFSRAFTRTRGTPPGQYRSGHRDRK